MHPTIEQLDTLRKSPGIRALPASAIVGSQEAWWDQVDKIAHLATQMDIWFVAQYASLVLRTYPGIANSVSARWSWGGTGSNVYSESYLSINDETFNPDCNELSQETDEALLEIDDGAALNALFHAVNDAFGIRQVADEGYLRKVFQNPITTLEQAGAICAAVNPVVRSALEKKLLEMDTPASRPAKGIGRL